ncbi:MAG TPA: hypothetical protein VEZ48_05690 [Sphingomonadaceae bacterium]|nr:hypothetical protein [Sphingomonadaceae bacterium]
MGRLAGLAAVACAPLLLGANTDQGVSYVLTPAVKNGRLSHVAVELRFRGDQDGETELVMPDKGGEDRPWPGASALSVRGGKLQPQAGAYRVLRHRPGAALTVRYRIEAEQREDPGPNAELYAPVIRPNWFHLIGEAGFAYPRGRNEAPARFRWGAQPRGWTLASDMDHFSSSRAGRVADVVGSVSLGAPDLRVARREVDGQPLRIAMRGQWRFTPEHFDTETTKVVRAVNAFWGGRGRPYLITLIPFGKGDANGVRSEGAGRDDAFAFGATTNLEYEDRRRTLAHEYLHTWIPSELGNWREGDDEGLDKWFGEGFADFYAARILLRAGLWSPEDFIRELNDLLGRYAGSPGRSLTNAQVAAAYFKDGDIRDLAYMRGELFAMLLDHRLRERGLGLDWVMRAQHKRALAEPRGSGTPAGVLFPRVLREYGGAMGTDLLTRHIENGEPILLPAEMFGRCARVETRPLYSMGFSISGGKVKDLNPSSPAYAAGLREGDPVRREPGDSWRPEISFRIGDGVEPRRAAFVRAPVPGSAVQRVVLTADRSSESHAACTRRLSGTA